MTTSVLEELPPVIPPPPRRLLRTVAFFAAIFGTGGLTGAGIATWYWQVSPDRPSTPPMRSSFFDGFVDRMKDDYELTDQQVERLKVVVQKNRERIDVINKDFQPKFRLSIDQMNSEIASLLTPEQRVQWEKKLEELRARWANRRRDSHRRDDHGPRGPGEKKPEASSSEPSQGSAKESSQ